MYVNFIKKIILTVYNTVLPKKSWLRGRIYNWIMWKIFPDPIDKIIYQYAQNKQKVRFIEVGANDGRTWDILFKFVKMFSWEGILIEPHPKYFKELMENYAGIRTDKIHFENVAISNRNETRKLYYLSKLNKKIKHYHELKGINSLSKAHVDKFRNVQSHVSIDSKTVKCITLEEVVKKYDFWNFQLLMIDTEGFDYKIIQSIDFSKFKPDLICFENENLTAIEINSINKVLSNNNYELLVDGINTLAFQSGTGLK